VVPPALLLQFPVVTASSMEHPHSHMCWVLQQLRHAQGPSSCKLQAIKLMLQQLDG